MWIYDLYRMEKEMPVYITLTRKRSEGLCFLHDRMPLILQGMDQAGAKPVELVEASMIEMVYEKVDSRPVNSVVQMSML